MRKYSIGYNNNFYHQLMSKLFVSRRQKEETAQRLENISPQKYGNGAYLDLTFTPSKLSEHILYREATHLKKIEEQSSAGRELHMANRVLMDQVQFLKRQRDGIEKSLNKMIIMYKEIIADMEGKTDKRIKQTQIKFKEEIQRYIKDKEEEAKYFQSEREIFEKHIADQEAQITKLKDQVAYLNRNKGDIQADFDQLKLEHQTLNRNFQQLEQRSKQNEGNLKRQIEGLKQKHLHSQVQWKDKFREEVHRKDLQIQKNAKIHKSQLEKVQNQRNADTLLKNQQIKNLTKTFETETNRLKQTVENKQKAIQNHIQASNNEKTKFGNLTREYQTEITHLTHEKNRLIEQIQALSRDNQSLARQKVMMGDELATQNEKLRELLYESSMELDKCRSELVGLAKDNQKLLTRVRSSQQEAKTWRDSYYLNRTRPG